jgi:uncharacterized protein involved in exopolysaccharide biosynthesis
MSSELAVVTAEIVDILPREHQTLANQEWVESSLKNNSIQEVLDAIQQHFDVSNRAIATCEKRLDKIGAKLDQHITYVDQKFAAVDSRVSQLEKDLAVTKAVSETQAANQQFLTGQMMSSINSTNQNVANVATKSNHGYPDPALWVFGAAFAACLLGIVISVLRVQSQPQPSTRSQVPQAESYECAGSRVRDGKVDFAACKKTGNEI